MSYPKIPREAEVQNLAKLSVKSPKKNRYQKKKSQKKKNQISLLKKPKTSGNPKKLAKPAGQERAANATTILTN
jgi:hypothetical protein